MTIDYSNASTTRRVETHHLGVVFPPAIVITAGEYASEGEPDLLIEVQHAIDIDGNDVGIYVARAIRSYIQSGDFTARVTDFAAADGKVSK